MTRPNPKRSFTDRGEWDTNGPLDDTTENVLPYPGDWRKAQETIARYQAETSSSDEDKWGEWEITAHEIDVPLAGFTVVVEGGNVSAVVSHDPAIVGMPYWTVDYDIDGADFAKGEVRSVGQEDGETSLAYCFSHTVAAATIQHPAQAEVVLDDPEV